MPRRRLSTADRLSTDDHPEPHADPVGASEIAERLGVQRGTVAAWRQRDHLGFPEPRWTVRGGPAWDWDADIVPWAKDHERL